MSQTPYSPMHGPEKMVTQEDMWAKLAKHAPAEVEIHLQKVGETPKAELRELLTWLKPQWTGPPENRGQSGFVQTQCGRYSVSKVSIKGEPVYNAWRRDREPATSLGCAPDFEVAKSICEKDRL